MKLTPVLGLLFVLFSAGPSFAQLPSNPKLGAEDLLAAQTATTEAGGATAELLYAARLDAVQKSTFDCLIVIYAKPVKNGKEYFATILRAGLKFPLALDKPGRALKPGDKYSRMGLKHEEGKSPILRLIAEFTDPAKGKQQRNLDYRFNGTAFVLENQSVVATAK